MGQKVHPGGLRVGVIHDWKSNWYVGKKEFPQYILDQTRHDDSLFGERLTVETGKFQQIIDQLVHLRGGGDDRLQVFLALW